MFFNDKFSTRPEISHWWWDKTSSMGNFKFWNLVLHMPTLWISLVLAHQNGVSCLSAVRGGVIGVGYWKGYLQRGKFYSWFSYLFNAWMNFLRLPSPRVVTSISGCGHRVLFAQQALERLFILILLARWNRLRHQDFLNPQCLPSDTCISASVSYSRL